MRQRIGGSNPPLSAKIIREAFWPRVLSCQGLEPPGFANAKRIGGFGEVSEVRNVLARFYERTEEALADIPQACLSTWLA